MHNISFPSLLLAATLSGTAAAQYSSGFEGLTASTTGEVVTGQDGYYLPAGTNSIDFLAFTYAGNSLGVPANPNGGANFIAGNGPGSPTFARAQRDMVWGAGVGTWTIGFDILAQFNGTLPSAQNLGSVSVQPFPGSQSFIALATWTDAATAANWDANYVWFDAAGAQLTEAVADPGFQNLLVNHWYRWETDIDLTTNQILEVRIVDLTTNTTVSNNPVDRYLLGGTAGAPDPTGFRFFAGGGVAGNTLAFDNASIDEFTPPCSDLEVSGKGQPGTTLGFALTGAAANMPAVLLIGAQEGVWVQRFGVLGTLVLGLSQPFTPTMMGMTDANGDVALDIRVPPGNLPIRTLFAQAMTVEFTPPAHGHPTRTFCTSDVEQFQLGGSRDG